MILVTLGTQNNDFKRILEEKKRSESGPIAQAKGLCLKEVHY